MFISLLWVKLNKSEKLSNFLKKKVRVVGKDLMYNALNSKTETGEYQPNSVFRKKRVCDTKSL